MWPIFFGQRTYTFIYVASMLVMAAVALYLVRRQRLRWWNGVLLASCYFFGMVVGAKLLFDLQHGALGGWEYLSPAYYFKGGLWGGPLAYLMLAVPLFALGRCNWRERLDLIAWTLPLPLIVAKVACFANGCCYGEACNRPWAVTFPTDAVAPASVARHATQLYEILVLVVIAVVFTVVQRRGRPGVLLAWFVLLYGIGRALTEAFRGDGARVPDVGSLTSSQVVCLAAAFVAGVVLVIAGNRTTQRAGLYAALMVVAGLFLTPLVWMLSVSLKPSAEVVSSNPTFLPQAPTLDPYRELLGIPTAGNAEVPDAQKSHFDYLLYARNTLIILVLSLAGMLLASSIAAYGFARIPFRGRNLMFGICLATMMIPFPVIMVPTYMLFQKLGWIGTFKPLWVPAWFGSAFNIFLLRQFFMGIPRELEESAMIDGCSRWGCFWRIMLPLAKPALAVVALFHCLAVWNDLVGPLIYLSHQEQYTLSLGLQTLQAKSGDTPWNQMMAAATLILLPILALFLLTQRTFVRGVATTGLKG